jgi:Ran GTPase-activating protein (RanGAP) involved in mRNA processing and transport
MGNQGAGRLAAVLGQCASLAHLDLSDNAIRAEGVQSFTAVLPQCASLARLDLRWNDLRRQEKEMFAAMQLPSNVLF